MSVVVTLAVPTRGRVSAVYLPRPKILERIPESPPSLPRRSGRPSGSCPGRLETHSTPLSSPGPTRSPDRTPSRGRAKGFQGHTATASLRPSVPARSAGLALLRAPAAGARADHKYGSVLPARPEPTVRRTGRERGVRANDGQGPEE